MNRTKSSSSCRHPAEALLDTGRQVRLRCPLRRSGVLVSAVLRCDLCGVEMSARELARLRRGK